MTHGQITALAAIVAGFAFGFVWGARTREALPVDTSFDGKVVTVRVGIAGALGQGLRQTLGLGA